MRWRDSPFRGWSLRETLTFIAFYIVASVGLELARRVVMRRLNWPGWTVDLLAFGVPVAILVTMLALRAGSGRGRVVTAQPTFAATSSRCSRLSIGRTPSQRFILILREAKLSLDPPIHW